MTFSVVGLFAMTHLADQVHCDCSLPALPLKTVVPFHDARLELVAGPQCPVIEVAGWLTLLNEFPRVKNSVVGLKPEVTIRLPAHLRAWTIPDETRVALSCGNNQKSRDGIHTVLQTLAPLKYPIDRRQSHCAATPFQHEGVRR